MKHCTIGFAALLVLVGTTQVFGVTQNGSFETGDFTGWTLVIPGGATSAVVWSHAEVPSGPTTFLPTDGNYFALLKTDGASVANKMYQNFSAAAGDVLSFDIFFDADDYLPYDDSGRAYLWDNVAGTQVGGNLFYADVSMVGDYGETPWTSVSHTFASSGNYGLYFEVQNVGDSVLDSYIGVDNVQQTYIPEPSTFLIWLLLGTLGLTVAWRRRKRAM